MGMSWGSFFDVLKVVAPVVLMVVPGGAALAPLAPLIIHAIGAAEQDPGKTGEEKKAYVMSLVADGVAATNVVQPGTIDPVAVTAAADEAVDTVIATVNAVKTAHLNQPGVPSLVVPKPA